MFDHVPLGWDCKGNFFLFISKYYLKIIQNKMEFALYEFNNLVYANVEFS